MLIIGLPHNCIERYMYDSRLFPFQNENVNRAHSSESKVRDLRRPDRCTAMKVLVKKSFAFVDLLWAMYVSHNGDLRYVCDLCERR